MQQNNKGEKTKQNERQQIWQCWVLSLSWNSLYSTTHNSGKTKKSFVFKVSFVQHFISPSLFLFQPSYPACRDSFTLGHDFHELGRLLGPLLRVQRDLLRELSRVRRRHRRARGCHRQVRFAGSRRIVKSVAKNYDSEDKTRSPKNNKQTDYDYSATPSFKCLNFSTQIILITLSIRIGMISLCGCCWFKKCATISISRTPNWL